MGSWNGGSGLREKKLGSVVSSIRKNGGGWEWVGGLVVRTVTFEPVWMEWFRSVGPYKRPFPAILKRSEQNNCLAQYVSTIPFQCDGNEMVAM